MLEAAIKVNFTVILSQIVEGFAFERHNFFFFFSLWDVYILMYWFFLICLWHKFLCFKVDEYLFVAGVSETNPIATKLWLNRGCRSYATRGLVRILVIDKINEHCKFTFFNKILKFILFWRARESYWSFESIYLNWLRALKVLNYNPKIGLLQVLIFKCTVICFVFMRVLPYKCVSIWSLPYQLVS